MKTKLRIIKHEKCSKLSSPKELTLTYDIGYDDEAKSLNLRITGNSSGGFFSNEWISLDGILETIEGCDPDKPFKALVFKSLYQSKGANNHGFLAAALRAEKLLLPVEKQKLAHTKGDAKAFKAAMQKLIKDQVSLKDEVAAADKIKDAKREEMLKNTRKTAKDAKQAQR